jgi:phospholipase C
MHLRVFIPTFAAVVVLSMIIVAGDLSAQQTRGPKSQSTETNFTAVENSASLRSVNHIIFMLQENRSFDHYFGALRAYWAANGYPEQSFDGLPQFNSPPGPAPKNPGCDPAITSSCKIDSQSPSIASYHYVTQCLETPTPFWNDSHHDLNRANPVSGIAKLDGFVWTASGWARSQHFYDTKGIRAMGYYDGSDLNYYYFMASSFATSDRWFAPVMTRTPSNRMYLLAGTSHGHAYPLNYSSSPQLSNTTIFQLLQNHGISWKIYVHPGPNGKTDPASLMSISYMNQFIFGNVIVQKYPQNIVPVSQYFTDLNNGTLPQVALIEPASNVALDEHPSDTDTKFPPYIQYGAQYVASIIDALMKSSYWTSSVFILTYDEFGGFYDHVPPHSAVSPDGIPPKDLKRSDLCYNTPSRPTCDFTYTGYRVPLIVISPFTKKNYVSHTTADYTAILKLIETRFGLPSLTKRDAAQMDMTEFFDFVNVPWWTPPTPPPQFTDRPCYLNQLP